MNLHRLFESQNQTKLAPNPLFSPGIVRMFRCDECGTIDKRSWFSTHDAAIEASKRRPGRWMCRACPSDRSTLIRCWFATVFADH